MTQVLDSAPPATDPRLRSYQLRVFWLLWSAYASYYLCRVNFAVAQPAILKEFPSWTSAQIGSIPSIYAAVYAIGQIVNGTLGQIYGTRRLMTVALLAASMTNLLFSFSSSFHVMQLLWAVNGWFQSAGWSLMVHTLSNWNTSARRGILIGRLSTCYQVGNVLSWLLAGFLCDAVGWRAAFLVPSLILLPMAVVFFFRLHDSPIHRKPSVCRQFGTTWTTNRSNRGTLRPRRPAPVGPRHGTSSESLCATAFCGSWPSASLS